MKKIQTLILALSFVSSLALAQTNTPVIDQRQQNQERRIEQGERSGQLTPHEAHHLEKGQEKVERMEDKAKADGVVTPREKRRLNRAENRQSRKIYRLKHNNRVQ